MVARRLIRHLSCAIILLLVAHDDGLDSVLCIYAVRGSGEGRRQRENHLGQVRAHVWYDDMSPASFHSFSLSLSVSLSCTHLYLLLKHDMRAPLSCAGKVADLSNADVAVDQYHRFEVDLSSAL